MILTDNVPSGDEVVFERLICNMAKVFRSLAFVADVNTISLIQNSWYRRHINYGNGTVPYDIEHKMK